jgi:hypothetical protein
MIPKTKLFELIEDYCLNNLDEPRKIEFDEELKNNKDLKKEVKFEKEVQAAIIEEDVLNLREKLKNTAEGNADKNKNTSFDLLDDFADIRQLTSTVSPEELLDYYDALPKAHIYQHGLISNENTHQFYREQELPDADDETGEYDVDDIEFEGLEEALLEKDILDLRGTLSSVSRTVQVPYTTKEIDEYMTGEMAGSRREEFEQELKINSSLQREVKIHGDLENALEELDITNLREKISNLMETETSWNVSEKDIEAYIDEELEGEMLEDFSAEFRENSDLKAEIALRLSVDKSIWENDIMALREKLKRIRHDIESKEIKSIVPDTKTYKMQWWKAGVAIAILLFAFAGLLKNEFGSAGQLYDNYYQSPEWSPQRSVSADVDFLQQANLYFTNGEYKKAITLYDQAIKESNEKFVYHFYKAASLQNLEKYEEAIPEYNRVITQSDNIFIEEAEWYKSLCYIKLGSKQKAKDQLLAIIERKGYYEKNAKTVLRRLRYSFN